VRLLPLAISSHPLLGNGAEALRQSVGSCQFCGHEAAGWQERVIGKGDGAGKLKEVWAEACAFCHLTQHLERADIDSEAIMIWLPELTQAALNRVAWQIYRRLSGHGVALDAVRFEGGARPPAARAAALRGALIERAEAAAKELGTSSASELGEVLLKLPAEIYQRRPQSLGGIRLLPLGRFFVDGRDVFPGLCR
jgi:intracellular multiplication protein IcmJ